MSNFFGTVNNYSEAIDVPVYEGYVAPTGDAIMSIAAEGVLEGLKLQGALHVADATIAYTAVHESASAAEAVLEGVLGNTIGKMKESLKKLWSKIKAWFASVRKTFQLMFAKGKDFIKKYKKEIVEKPSAGFTYDGFAWNIEKGNSVVLTVIKAIDDIALTNANAASFDNSDKNSYDLSDIKEKILKSVGNTLGSGVDDMSEIKTKLSEIYRGGEDTKQEIKDFAKVSKGSLIDIIEKSDKHQKVITDVEKEIDKQFNQSIKELEKMETSIAKAPDSDFGDNAEGQSKMRASRSATASMLTNVTKYAQSLNSAISAAAVENIKAAATEAESVLKQFIKYKGTKESFGGYEETSTGSVLENFMANIRI